MKRQHSEDQTPYGSSLIPTQPARPAVDTTPPAGAIPNTSEQVTVPQRNFPKTTPVANQVVPVGLITRPLAAANVTRKAVIDTGLSTNQQELCTLFTSLYMYLEERCDTSDLQVLSFGLQHFFVATARLYEIHLPELTLCERRRRNRAQDLFSMYCTWLQLNQLSALFARVEGLCFLLMSSTLNLLDALDLSCLGSVLYSYNSPLHHHPVATPEAYQQAVDWVQSRLQSWQQSYNQQPAFTEQFGHLREQIPALSQLDTTTVLLWETSETVFQKLLPAFYELSSKQDEAIATLLLDLSQQIDQVQFAIGALQEPLLQLVQKYA